MLIVSCSSAPKKNESEEFSKHVNEVARFPGGDSMFIQFIHSNFKYPKHCLDEGLDGYVIMRFEIDTNGKVGNIRVMKGSQECPSFELEAHRVIALSPPWKPEIYAGQKVKVSRQIPIKLSAR